MSSGKGKKVFRRITGTKPEGHGPRHESQEGWVDPKPYVSYLENGIYEGYDGSYWKYYRLPDDVKTEWLKQPEEAIANQHFFLDLCRAFGMALNDQIERSRNDIRRPFHIQITQDRFMGIQPYEDCTPAHADYLRRMSQEYSKPIWYGYIGVKLLPSSIYHEAYGLQAKVQRYVQVMKNPEEISFHLYRQDISDVDDIMLSRGFKPLNLRENHEDHEHLTAWHGVSDEEYGLPRQLETTPVREPVHGYSLLTPKWGEISFHAIKPLEELFMVNPTSESAKWAKPLYRPGSNVVCINIRGEIRSNRVADNLLDNKRIKRIDEHAKGSTSSYSDSTDSRRVQQEYGKLEHARDMVSAGHPLLDNLEIIVGTLVREGVQNTLSTSLNDYNLTSAPIVHRQPHALGSTMPTYPKHIFPIKKGNDTRSPLSNQMLPGVLAMSSIFRSTKPCDSNGIILGLSDGGYEYQEIYTSVDAAYRSNNVPGFLVTGRGGAGKTQELLQMTVQTVYQGHGAFYLNPKRDSTLKPVFDHLGGVTINMGTRYLNDHPGLMDPVFFLNERESVANSLSDAIFMALRMYDDTGSQASQRRTTLKAEIMDRSVDPRNKCSYDILFGNEQTNTPPISDQEVLRFVENRIKVSPFWRAFISSGDQLSDLQQELASSKAVLIEWDGTMDLPTPKMSTSEYRDEHIDSILSVTLAFKYGVELVGGIDQDGNRLGGSILVDEAWTLTPSHEVMQVLNKGAREWRQGNIMFVLATQRILDFMASGKENMATYFARYLFMAISGDDEEELDMYFQLTGLPKTTANRNYIVNAGISKQDGVNQGNIIPRGYYKDAINNWEGGILCGPWPEPELSKGRTDKEGEQSQSSYQDNSSSYYSGDDDHMFGGILSLIASQDSSAQDISDPY